VIEQENKGKLRVFRRVYEEFEFVSFQFYHPHIDINIILGIN
jgi:hypothetical protein